MKTELLWKVFLVKPRATIPPTGIQNPRALFFFFSGIVCCGSVVVEQHLLCKLPKLLYFRKSVDENGLMIRSMMKIANR
jgi:hypothetical protein